MAAPVPSERLAEIRQRHNDMRRYEPISSRIYTLDVRDLLRELDRLTSDRWTPPAGAA